MKAYLTLVLIVAVVVTAAVFARKQTKDECFRRGGAVVNVGVKEWKCLK